MPIVDGRYEMCVGSNYTNIEEGLEAIRKRLGKSRNVRVNGIPMGLLNELKPMLAGKDVKIILPLGAEKDERLEEIGPVAVTKARIYQRYDDKEVSSGSIIFPDVIFNIVYDGEKILGVSTLEYARCVKCMKEAFEGGWRYAKK
ncbi:MAG: hypothetical protein FJ151_03505 [Euryarchaeota archaeon]|nr:hypothetical protein [Euryarchaeota archaeon]